MKKLLIVITILCISLALFSCGKGEDSTETSTDLNTEETDMIGNAEHTIDGAVIKVNKNSIEISVDTTQKESGTFIINIHESTLIYDSFGNEIDINQIKVDDSVKISYNGQVAKSYPPQITAIIVQVKK